jgi:NAD(P)-dependent dehydrogenase (short-subunit alcohol dehydrogenase family)
MAHGGRDEVVLITGCSEGGIGAALAMELCDAGFTVVATSRLMSTMKMFERHQHIHVHQLDLLLPDSIKQAVEIVIALYGRIDILINNAAIPCAGPLAEVPIEIVDRTYRTNYLGPVMLIQAVVPHMVARGKGKIVNVGSIVCLASAPFSGVYTASKAAFHCSTDALRLELKPFNIDVMLLVSGAVKTNIVQRAAEIIRSSASALRIFKPYEEYLLRRTKVAHQNSNTTPADEFARKAVARILRPSPPACYIYGFMSGIYRILYFCPYWLRDWWFTSKMPKWMTENHKQD